MLNQMWPLELLKRSCLSLIRLAVWSAVTQPSCPSCKDVDVHRWRPASWIPVFLATLSAVKLLMMCQNLLLPWRPTSGGQVQGVHIHKWPPESFMEATINTNLYSLYFLMPAARHDSADRGRRYQKSADPAPHQVTEHPKLWSSELLVQMSQTKSVGKCERRTLTHRSFNLVQHWCKP